MPTYPQKLWKKRDPEVATRKVDLESVGKQLEGYWPILDAMEKPGFMMTDQIGLLVFPQFLKGNKVANDRLKRLFDLGLIGSFRLRRENQSGPGGQVPYIHYLTREGAQLLAAYRQVSLSELVWRERQELLSMSTIFHRLELVDLHCALLTHCREHALTLERFDYEPRYPLPRWPNLEAKELWPDALAEIEGAGARWSVLVEVDRNTERPKRFAERVIRYEAFYRSGEWEKWTVEAPTVLVMVSEGGQARVQALREATAQALVAAEATFSRYRFAVTTDLYQIGRSHHGYLAPVASHFHQAVCLKVRADMPVPLLDTGGGVLE